MTLLPYDYSRCLSPAQCTLSGKCRRTTPGHPTYQAYTKYPGGDDCDGFYPEVDK